MDSSDEYVTPPAFKLVPGVRLISDWQEPTRIQEAGGEEACFRLHREMADFPVVARFTVDGEPASKSRARFNNRGSKVYAYTPEKTRLAEEKVAALFWKNVNRQEFNGKDTDVTYGVMALFFCGTRQRRDVDNMTKLVLDGLNKVAWPDDDQVLEISARKELVLPADARTEIVIYRIGKVQRFTVACATCGKEVATFPSWNQGRARRFCSRECAYKSHTKPDTRTCANCGKEFRQAGRPKSKYCSRECSSPDHYVTLKCDGCGTEFTRQRCYERKKNFCSDACRDQGRGELRAMQARGTCETCGGPTSKKIYRQCAFCRGVGRTPKRLNESGGGDE